MVFFVESYQSNVKELMRLSEWWGSLVMFERIFWYIAVPFTVLFFIQLVLTFTGMGGDDADGEFGDDGGDLDGDGEADGDGSEGGGFRIFTVKNFITFFTVFGWSGITLHNAGAGEYFVLFGSLLIAVAVMLLVAMLFVSITRLAQSGTMDVKSAKGRSGEVYLPIPAGRSGRGKITITLQGALREIDAVTEGETLPRGTAVRVVDIAGNGVLLVEKA